MFCTNCGKEIKDGSTFCVYCGTKVAEEAGNYIEQPSEKKSALQADTADSSVQENRTGKETDTEKIRQIVGKNAEYYLKQFESIRQTGKGKLNWAAFFLGPFHVGYRNNWKGWWKAVRLPALCTLGCGILAGIISLFQMIIGMVLMFVMCIFVMWLGIAQILYALRFNKIYMQHVEQKVAENNLKTDTSIGRGILTYFAFSAAYMIVMGICSAGMLSSAFGGAAIDDWDTDIENENYIEDFSYDESNDIAEQLPEDIGNDMEFDDTALAVADYSLWAGDTYQRVSGPAASIRLVDINDEGITFTASIGVSGYAAYVDMREYQAAWSEEGNAVYYEADMDYQLAITLNDDGSINVVDNQPYWGGLALAGVYTKESVADFPTCEFVFFHSSDTYISTKECEGMNELECRIARNEIYARHGRIFADESLQAYFDSCSWYEGFIEPDVFSQDMLSDIELENLSTIKLYESDMGFN